MKPKKNSDAFDEIIRDIEGDLTMEKINTDLNTMMNGHPSIGEKKIIKVMRKIVALKVSCEQCDKNAGENCTKRNHIDHQHEKLKDACKQCDESAGENYRKGNHIDHQHEKSLTTETVFLSHHEEEISDECQIEVNPLVWEMFHSEDDVRELTEEEKKEVLKLHKYFAHRNARKLWENLLQPSGRLKGKKKLIMDFLDKCEVCRRYRRTPSRPKVGLPKAGDINEVVSIDLKILKKSGKKEVAILYLHDEFSKLIRGQVVNDKKADTIIKAIENKWIVGGGIGPGHPSRGFFSDNGGEFLNQDLIDFAASLDISIKMTAANSPWMNGGCERSHATVDRIVEKILEDDSTVGIQKAVDTACFVKNSEINKTGFSPIQLFCGKSPSFPGYSDCTPGSIELEGSNEYLKILRRMDSARLAARQIDCDQKIKVALKSKINTACEKSYSFGDQIWFKLESSHKWRAGKVLGQDGKVLFVKYGNFIRRVPLDFVVPANEYTSGDDEEIDQNDVDNQERMQDDAFENVEIVAQKDIEIDRLKKANSEQSARIKKLEQESESSRRVESSSSVDRLSPGKKRTEKISEEKANKSMKSLILPKQFKRIKFRLVGTDTWQFGKVVNKHKNKSIYKNLIGVRLDGGFDKEYDFSKEVEEWMELYGEEDTDALEPCCSILHTKIIPKAQARKRPEFEDAIQQEIKKFEKFSAFSRVKDDGQYAIKTRWVYSETDDLSKGSSLKARLCMRGDTEEDIGSIRADSPTAHKDTLKLGLAIAANEDFDLISGDIKSAFLQGMSLQRKVYVLPPSEAKEDGSLWLLEKGAYGLIDGSRLFYLELKKTLETIGMKALSGDSAFFTFHVKGKLLGFVCIHVDDLLMAGNSEFESIVVDQLRKHFKFSKIEKKQFKYLGCDIQKLPSGNISLNQNEYIQNIKEVTVPSGRNSCKVNDLERKEIRRVVGELLWVSLMTRPDLSFDINQLSTRITTATIKDLKDAQRLVYKAKLDPISLNFTRLGNKGDLRIKLFTDASFNNQENKLRSTEGRVLLLESKSSSKANIFSWKTKKISRVCRSVKGAETRALENGLDEAIHFARMTKEIYDGVVNLKQPRQVDVEAKTDNQGLWENLNNTRQCDEKMLRNSIALIKEMLEKKEVDTVDWVETDNMLADVLTKKGGNYSWIKNVLTRNVMTKNIENGRR